MHQVHDGTIAWEHAKQELIALENQDIDRSWYERWSAALDVFSDVYIQALWDFYRNTNDPEAKAHLRFITQEVKPQCNTLSQVLTQKSADWSTNDPYLDRLVKQHRREVRFGIPEAVALDKEIDGLVQEYDEALATLTVTVDQPISLSQARTRWREEKDREKRRDLWVQIQEVRASADKEIDELFVALLTLRHKKAHACGFENFLDFAWDEQFRDSYKPSDALHVVGDLDSAFANVYERKAAYLGSHTNGKTLRPWDEVPLLENASMDGAFNEAAYANAIVRAYSQLSPELGSQVRAMASRGSMDLMARPFKSTKNFSTVLCGPNEGLVFCNGTGDVSSLRVMLHETGHAVHYEKMGRHNLMFERTAPREIMEFVAYCFQFVATEALAKTGTLSTDEFLQLKVFAAETMLDVFQDYTATERFSHWVYGTTSTPDIPAIDAAWEGFRGDFSIDWTGFRHIKQKGWQHSHIVASPLYTFDYIAAYLGMLLFIAQFREHPDKAIKDLTALLKYGRTKTVVESFALVGITFPFQETDLDTAREVLESEFIQDLF